MLRSYEQRIIVSLPQALDTLAQEQAEAASLRMTATLAKSARFLAMAHAGDRLRGKGAVLSADSTAAQAAQQE